MALETERLRINADTRVLVIGLGRNGGGAGIVRYLLRAGATVTVTDTKSAEELESTLAELREEQGFDEIVFRLGEDSVELLADVETVIKSPGVPYSAPLVEEARTQGTPVLTDMDLFFQDLEEREGARPYIIGVTGTRGKSTTSTLIYEFLKREGYETYLAGNIGRSVLDILPFIREHTYVVLELSSFQLEDFPYRPDIGVITNLFADHLNRHGSMAAYARAKRNLIENQTSHDYAVLNAEQADVEEMADHTEAKIRWFGLNAEGLNREAWIEDDHIYIQRSRDPICAREECALSGDHNTRNLLAALSVASVLDLSVESMNEVVTHFAGLPDRLEHVRTRGGVSFINDTTSTMPEATIAALQAFQDTPMHVIAGGGDKDVSYEELAQWIQTTSVQTVTLLPGKASDILLSLLRDIPDLDLHMVDSLDRAVHVASENAREGDVVLFSPAATSFVSFANEFERGEVFRNVVDDL